MSEKNKFFRVLMVDGLYEYVIIEAYDDNDASETAHHLYTVFGQPSDEWPEEVEAPLAEPWPIFTQAWFEALMAAKETNPMGYSERTLRILRNSK